MKFKKYFLYSVLLIISSPIWGQYKRMSIGFTNSLVVPSKSNSFNHTGLNFQYNFKKYFSVCTGATFEKRHYSEDISSNDQKYTAPYDYRYDNLDVNSKFVNVPISLKVTFGEKFQIYTSLGMNTSFSLKSRITDKVIFYSDDYHSVTYSEDKFATKRIELNYFFNIGLSRTIFKRLLFFAEVRYISNINNAKNRSYIDVHRFYGNQLIGGLAYQFNSSKKSEYKFSSYKITLN